MGKPFSNVFAVRRYFRSKRTTASYAQLRGKKKRMESTLRRLKALLSGIYCEVDLARNDLVYSGNEMTHDALENAHQLIETARELIADELGDDYDVEELNFDGKW